MIDKLAAIVREAAPLAQHYFGSIQASQVEHKGEVDLGTRADREVEAFLRERLLEAFPGAGFVGEEGASSGVLPVTDDPFFVVDPIDGTTNFVHGHPFYAISVALRQGGETVLAAVLCPPLNELFTAERGAGAYLGDKRLCVSDTADLLNSLVATGFACVRQRQKPDNLPLFTEVIYRVRGVRRGGSAALDCCYVAAGRLDLFWEYNLRPWDIAAGSLIVREAGGTVSDLRGTGNGDQGETFLASNGRLHPLFLELSRARSAAG